MRSPPPPLSLVIGASNEPSSRRLPVVRRKKAWRKGNTGGQQKILSIRQMVPNDPLSLFVELFLHYYARDNRRPRRRADCHKCHSHSILSLLLFLLNSTRLLSSMHSLLFICTASFVYPAASSLGRSPLLIIYLPRGGQANERASERAAESSKLGRSVKLGWPDGRRPTGGSARKSRWWLDRPTDRLLTKFPSWPSARATANLFAWTFWPPWLVWSSASADRAKTASIEKEGVNFLRTMRARNPRRREETALA